MDQLRRHLLQFLEVATTCMPLQLLLLLEMSMSFHRLEQLLYLQPYLPTLPNRKQQLHQCMDSNHRCNNLGMVNPRLRALQHTPLQLLFRQAEHSNNNHRMKQRLPQLLLCRLLRINPSRTLSLSLCHNLNKTNRSTRTQQLLSIHQP